MEDGNQSLNEGKTPIAVKILLAGKFVAGKQRHPSIREMPMEREDRYVNHIKYDAPQIFISKNSEYVLLQRKRETDQSNGSAVCSVHKCVTLICLTCLEIVTLFSQEPCPNCSKTEKHEQCCTGEKMITEQN